MLKHFIFDKLSDTKNSLKIVVQVSKLRFSPIVKARDFALMQSAIAENHTAEYYSQKVKF